MESAPGMNSGRALSTAPSPEDCAALNNTNTCKKKDQNKAAKACSGGKPKKCAKLCSKKKKSLSAECKAACCQMQASRPCVSQPTHNREPYDTLLSDTVATDPSVEPMPLSSTRSMRMNVSLRGPRSASRPARRPVRAYARSARRRSPAWYLSPLGYHHAIDGWRDTRRHRAPQRPKAAKLKDARAAAAVGPPSCNAQERSSTAAHVQ